MAFSASWANSHGSDRSSYTGRSARLPTTSSRCVINVRASRGSSMPGGCDRRGGAGRRGTGGSGGGESGRAGEGTPRADAGSGEGRGGEEGRNSGSPGYFKK